MLAQDPIRSFGNRIKSIGGASQGSGGKDSLQRRDKNADSITIHYRYLDSTRNYLIDSSINDYTTRFPIPATNIYLGNNGTASRSLLFSPRFTAGWDPGFHALDIYKWKLERIRFFNTTRPYSELNYALGSRSEQLIEVFHTQNIKPNWNFSFNYRLINSPGFFKNQKTNHNNYLVNSWYRSVNQRYNNYFTVLQNKLQASENGGMKDDKDYLNDPIYKDRYNIDTKLGGDNPIGLDFFNTKIGTGNKYSEFTVLMRQQYDFGRKDSIVTDSTVIPLFYPRLRFEHTISYSTYKYVYADNPFVSSTSVYEPDSAYYKDNYNYEIPSSDTVYFRDRWKEIVNDFSIYQFPDAKNQQQFIKLGIAVQNLTGEFRTLKKSFYNVYGHAEYRNKTRNLKWDIEANGKLYFTGLNAGDYQAYASLQRLLGKKIGYLQLGFENVNRTPSFIFDSRSSFYFLPTAIDFKKENSTHFFASVYQPAFKLKLTGHYYLLTNYTYITKFSQLKQENALFNVLQIGLQKTIRLSKRWNWHADVYFQQAIGNAPANLPQLFTRNRIGYEGNLGLKNLDIAFGLEVRYHSPYKADNYSPVTGQFFYQDSITIRDKTPDIAAYVHFRIKGIKFYIRGENLNTMRDLGGFGFTNNNLAAPGCPYPGLVIRFGIFWSFVN
ncbi:MAG TPA: putative porin [Chitinophagaceae bacterium]